MVLQKCSVWKVLQVFFKESLKIHYIKEISRKISLAHTSVKNHIDFLTKEGFIEQDNTGIIKGYKAKRDTPSFIFYKKIDNLINLRESGLIECLKEHYPKTIILFGSYDKGEDVDTSDVDIFIDSKKFKVETEKFEKYLNRKLQIIFKEETSKSLMLSINQGTILYGER